ncbi:MAG: hypothetical protein JWP29_1087 [Rhodoferax sp.]|nr:hypothetical protein [Rhodoferax sp.]
MSDGANSFTISMDTSGLEKLFDQLGEDAAAAVRPAAQAGAQVLYDAVRANVAGLGKKSGKLAEAIYQAFSPERSDPTYAEYHVSWNSKKAPHGHLVEHGYLMRYKSYKGADGQVRLMVRPGMDGVQRPRRGDSRATKDAYYIPLPQPVQVAGKAFIGRAQSSMDQAFTAAETLLLDRVGNSIP